LILIVSLTKFLISGPQNKLTPTEDILNSILPPREWTENGQLWVQYVSSAPSTKKDVLHLQSSLDTKLQQREARETGICPIREELYSQSFDEIIRQVTIMCAERGLLLLRVRKELNMEIAAYQTLYESSVAYGMRGALRQKSNKKDVEARMATLEKECTLLEAQIKEQVDRTAAMQKRAKDEDTVMEEIHVQDVTLIKGHNAKLRETLKEKLSVEAEKKKEEEAAANKAKSDEKKAEANKEEKKKKEAAEAKRE